MYCDESSLHDGRIARKTQGEMSRKEIQRRDRDYVLGAWVCIQTTLRGL